MNTTIEKNFFKGFFTILAWMTLVIITMFSLASCGSANSSTEETEAPTTITVEKELKVVDMLETVGSYGDSSVGVCYMLLENGDIQVITYNKYVYLPYTKEEARQIMAFRRGEEVKVTVLETIPTK